MRQKNLISFLIILLLVSCSSDNKVNSDYLPFEKYIRFNHLYIVIDDSTYTHLSNNLDLFDEFSIFREINTTTDAESWSGKYLIGKNHYLEIFRPDGYDGARIGDFGIGFMPTKLGTLDSLYRHWNITFDSVNRTERKIVENGITYPWAKALSIPTTDTLKISIWLMEYEIEEMLNVGFNETDLEKEIEFWDYSRYSVAKRTSTLPDSIKYDKLFQRVTSLKLNLSRREFEYIRNHLLDFGFVESGKSFHGNDIDIDFELTEADHFILKEVDFKLAYAISDREINLNRLTIKVTGDKASLIFKY